ncbi:MAG: cation:proton antiporter [Deltaproteobacteria bacterium]|nr:cation:proton antiporter [Deltaproteobacteria bacterium]
MEQSPLLKDLIVIALAAVFVVVLLSRAGLPTIVGLLFTGIIIGPGGLGLVEDMHNVERLAGIGVVLLLFTIGLEFSLTKIFGIRKETVIGGSLQVALTVLAVWIIAMLAGIEAGAALIMGFVAALSSTAISLKLLMDRGEMNSPYGKLSVGILLFQDICVVLMVMVVQGMGQKDPASVFDMAKGLGLAMAAIGMIVVLAYYLVPKLFREVVKLRNREVFILTIVLVCFGTAWAASLSGLSLALGAFVAGLIIAESEYSDQIVAEVMPLRDTFISFFFISIGMLVEFRFFIGHLPLIIAATLAVMFIKTAALAGVGQVLRYPLRLSIIVGLNLAQIGEFSFVIINMAAGNGLIDREFYQTLLSVTIVTMAVTPFVFEHSQRFAYGVALQLGSKDRQYGHHKKVPLSNHVIILGYGLNGENLARVLKGSAIPFVVLDINDERLRKARQAGHKAYYGDASHPEILKKMSIESAKMVVVAISDPIGTRRAVKTAKELNPAASVVVRTRYIKEVDELFALGANQVIPEEFETSVEIFAIVLKDYRIPANIIQNQIDLIRGENYAMLRHPSLGKERLSRLTAVLEASITDTFYIDSSSPAAGRTLEEIGLRKKSGTSAIAVIRGGKARTNPHGDFLIETGDVLVLLGSHVELNQAFELLKGNSTLV